MGNLRIQDSGAPNPTLPLVITIVAPTSMDRNGLDAVVDQLPVRVELARTASLRAVSDGVEDQLRLTRRMSDLAQQAGDPRATMRVSTELRKLASGEPLDRDSQEGTIEVVRGGARDA